jgi:membrane peptidoglycan carboxypeptidase
VVEWGPGVWGAQAASRYYFGKEANGLTASEACLLAVLLPSPEKRNPFLNRAASLVRKRDRLLLVLFKQGKISGEEYTSATSQPIRLRDGSAWP